MNMYVISEEGWRRLEEFIASYRPFLASESEQLVLLRRKLAEAVIVPHDRLSPVIVSMYSTVELLDLHDRASLRYTLVYPDEASAAHNLLSVLSPLGTALLGLKEGDFFECRLAQRTEQFAIRNVLCVQWSARRPEGPF